MDLREFRRTYPMYDGLSDQELADRLYGKFYAGKIPRETFDRQIGLQPAQQPAQAPQQAAPEPRQLNLPGPPDLMRIVPDALNVFGKLGARFLTPEDDNPSGSELALDAAIGAAGPATTGLAKGVAKGVVGMTDDVVKKGAAAAKKILGDEFHLGMSWRALSRVLDRADVGQRDAVRRALIEGLHTQTRGGLSQRGGELGALGTYLLNGDPVNSIGILLGGYGASALQRGSARSLLNTDRFVNWLLQAPKALPSRYDLIGSLGALAAEKAINSDLRTAINDLMDSIRRSPEPQEEPPPPDRERRKGPTFRNPPAETGDPFSGRRRLHRDPRTGRFTDAQNPRAIDHSGLEDLFGD